MFSPNNSVADWARYRMWCRLIPSYKEANRGTRNKLQLAYCMDNSFSSPNKVEPRNEDLLMASNDCCAHSYPDYSKAYACKAAAPACQPYTSDISYTPITTIASGTSIGLGNLQYVNYPAGTNVTVSCCGIMPNKKDEQMFNSTSDLEIQQRNFLKTRAVSIEETKRAEARKAFNIDYRFVPKTKDEFFEALKTATIDETRGSYFTKDGSNAYGYNAEALLSSLRLTDGTKIDREGYDATKAKLTQALTDLKDMITVAPLTDAVAAFEVFKKATFH